MKVALYAISKNVAPAVPKFMDRVAALGLPLYVLDHSDDGTTELLRDRGAIVDTTPMKRHFGDMKNYAMDMVDPGTEWVCNIDLDEWINVDAMKRLIDKLNPFSNRVFHLYQPDGRTDRIREESRVHARHGFRWWYPIHEELVCGVGTKLMQCPEVILTQWPDPNRKHTWVDMLLEAVRVHPSSHRMRMLAGRDLYFDGQYQEALDQLNAYLNLPNENSFDRAYVFGLLARCYRKLFKPMRGVDEEIESLQAAVKCYPRREAVVDLAHALLVRGDDAQAIAWSRRALEVTEGQFAPHNDPGAWSFKPHEIIMQAAYNLDDLDTAIKHGEVAATIATGDDQKRINQNLLAFKEKRDEMGEMTV